MPVTPLSDLLPAGASQRLLRGLIFSMALLLMTAGGVHAQTPPGPQAQPTAADPALEKRVFEIANELRCLVCQNQTIADSDAGLAVDLRNQVREMLSDGKSKKEIIDFMTARYGDFVLYRPPMKVTTLFLWFGPALLLGSAIVGLVMVLRRRASLPDDHFDPEDDIPDDLGNPPRRSAP